MDSKKSTSLTTILVIALISVAIIIGQGHGLSVGFYNGKCNWKNAEDIVFKAVQQHFKVDQTIVPALLRLQFHDCFVGGYDASILLNGNGTEKTAPPIGSVQGYELIDAAKEAIEKECPGVVSCADIIVIATRDAVFLGSEHWYNVETGRLDGMVSLATDAVTNLPSPTISVSAAITAFASRNLNASDFVLLLGGHTVGITHCSFLQNRLYNSNNWTGTGPSMDPSMEESLKKTCPKDGSGRQPLFFWTRLRAANSNLITGSSRHQAKQGSS